MYKKVDFSVVKFSGEDPRYHAINLNTHGPDVKEWRSEKFCFYPQKLVIQLGKKWCIKRIQILAHQFIIPEKVEIYVGDNPDDRDTTVDNALFSKIGFINLNSNEKSQFKSRELKSINLEATGRYVQILLHQNHMNKYNRFNQVALVAINVIGFDPDSTSSGVSYPDIRDDLNLVSMYDELAFNIYTDREVIKIMKRLEVKKTEAVKHERYEYAKKLKHALKELQKAGLKLGKYEMEKSLATENEEFGKASAKKESSDAYRQLAYSTLAIQDLLEDNGRQAANDIETTLVPVPDSVSERRNTISKELSTPPKFKSKPRSPSMDRDIRTLSGSYSSYSGSRSATTPTNRPLEEVRAKNNSAPGKEARYSKSPGMEDYDNRMLPAVKHLSHGMSTPESLSSPDSSTGSKPTQLSEEDLKLAELPIAVFGLETVEGIFSKSYEKKETSLKEVQKELEKYSPKNAEYSDFDANSMVRSAIFVIHKGLTHKVTKVFCTAADVLMYLFGTFPKDHKLSKVEIGNSMDIVLPELLSKCSDSSRRLQAKAQTCLLHLANSPESKVSLAVQQELTKDILRSHSLGVPIKQALSRVELVEMLLKQHGVSMNKENPLSFNNIMEFAASGLQYPSEPVRKVSEKMMIMLYLKDRSIVKKYLSKSDEVSKRSMTFKHLLEEIDRIDRSHDLEEMQEAVRKTKEVAISKKDRGKTLQKLNRSIQDLQSPEAESQLITKKADDMTCIFCKKTDPSFAEKGMDVHYWKFCPLLTRCREADCKNVVEVKSLTDHLIYDCANKKRYKKCVRCTEAVAVHNYEAHVNDRRCLACPKDGSYLRCPCCHSNIKNSEEAWLDHFLGSSRCKVHDRVRKMTRKDKIVKL